jgi:hypothetical protein
MDTETIFVEVDADTARAFSSAPAPDRRKLELLLGLRLRELTVNPPRPLQQVMDDMSRQAESRGLTSEILQSLLNDE